MVTQEDATYIRRVFPEIEMIKNKELAQKVVEVWAEVWHESAWAKIEDVPKNPSRDADLKLVPHTRGTIRLAIAMAESVLEFHGVGVDMDVVIAGALLHDVDKLLGYGPVGGTGAKTRFGKLLPHGVYGGYKMLAKGMPMDLVHLVVSHSSNATNTVPITLEGIIVRNVDHSDSEAMHYMAANTPAAPKAQ